VFEEQHDAMCIAVVTEGTFPCRSNDNVSAIAFDAGFSDLSTFNRRFRRLTGLSPSAYRARWSAAAG
jgi:AraC-like DNA-binding protein